MKISTLILTILVCFSTIVDAQGTQNRANELMKQAQSSLEQKEYTKARYLFIQAYGAFATQENYPKAVECGIQGAALYHRENYYKEAFDLCRGMDQLVWAGEQKQQKQFYPLRFQITKERLQMYIGLKNAAQAKIQLDKLAETAGLAKNDSLSENLLYTQASYYYTFGQNTQGDACFQKLINQYKAQKNYDKVNECYKKLIAIGRKSNNASLVARTYENFIVWTDSVKAMTAQDELNVLKRKYDESQQIIQEKEDTLSGKQYMIANEHNELKTQFIQNISAQMEPTLDTLASSAAELSDKAPQQAQQMQGQVAALKKFSNDIQELSTLENSLTEPYEMKEINVNTFCEATMDKVKEFVQPEVSTVVNAAKLQIKTNPEQLERILIHLLKNAAEYTESGKIFLDFKKRGAHTHQFIISDTGTGIPVEKQENLFKPFTEIKDLTEGDGLGLPICALIATKMNGSLTLDTSYTKGSRFVLELHT